MGSDRLRIGCCSLATDCKHSDQWRAFENQSLKICKLNLHEIAFAVPTDLITKLSSQDERGQSGTFGFVGQRFEKALIFPVSF
jgi:hypothetical protein